MHFFVFTRWYHDLIPKPCMCSKYTSPPNLNTWIDQLRNSCTLSNKIQHGKHIHDSPTRWTTHLSSYCVRLRDIFERCFKVKNHCPLKTAGQVMFFILGSLPKNEEFLIQKNHVFSRHFISPYFCRLRFVLCSNFFSCKQLPFPSTHFMKKEVPHINLEMI